MKFFTFTFLLFFINIFVYCQTDVYRFDGSMYNVNNLNQLNESFSCGSLPGFYSFQTINTSTGFCSIDTTFCFNDGAGIKYNNSGLISNQYTIHLFFKFNSLGGYSRVVDFTNSFSDNGIYLLNNCLNFYPSGNVGICPYFNPGVWYLLSFVRNGLTNQIKVFVNGVLFHTFVDVGNNYRPTTNITPIIFFRDDNVFSCEAQPGCVKYLSISPNLSSDIEINNFWLQICYSILSLNILDFKAECSKDEKKLKWDVENEDLVKSYRLKSSINGIDWGDLDLINKKTNSENINSYIFELNKNVTNNYYSLLAVDFNNQVLLEKQLFLKTCDLSDLNFRFNNETGFLFIDSRLKKEEIKVFDNLGRIVYSNINLMLTDDYIDLSNLQVGNYMLVTDEYKYMFQKY